MKNIRNDIQILLNLFNAAKYEDVITKSKKLIRKSPEYIILYNILGSAYQNVGSLNLAKQIFIKGYKMEPSNIAIMNNLANAYKNIGDIELSEELFLKIIRIKPDYINAYINLGNLKRDENNFKEALKLYNKALKIDNKIPIVHYSLALAHQGLGDFGLAIEYAKKTVELDPTFTQADMLISQSTKYEDKNTHYKEMNLKVNNLKLNSNQRTNLLFSIAKANEDMGEIEKSFEYLDQGNKLRRKDLSFDLKQEINFFNDIKKIFNKINIKNINKEISPEKKIIFILGMPRSGTSLAEQIITSHSNVFGAGELPQLSRIVRNMLMINKTLSEERINELINDKIFADQLRKVYYDYIKRFSANENYITDKAPLNFRWIGLIKILFPNSKIIHCSRNPKDNCLSLYKNFFEGGLDFSYDQNELGKYYNLYLDLMNFWNKFDPNSFYEAKYEEIINNPNKEIQKIIKFCDLPWEENCLKFYKNKTPIKTMSTAQARKPIYKSSVNSFEKFAPFLKDLNKLI